MRLVSDEPSRCLTLTDVGLEDLIKKDSSGSLSAEPLDRPIIGEDDPVLVDVKKARALGYAGVLIAGPPGTGKSWYAQQCALALSGSWSAVRSVQFHPSYQYEDFVFGYVPLLNGGFELRAKEFASICAQAQIESERLHVLVIDEISRTDVVRVFGEALTYIEPSKRDIPFQVASGEEMSVPKNLFLIGTMNPWDRGVDELDMALERRFAQVDLWPSASVLEALLVRGNAPAPLLTAIISFFDELQRKEVDEVHLGHAYFLQCLDNESTKASWRLRILPSLRRACRFDREMLEEILGDWDRLVRPVLGAMLNRGV